MFYIHGPLERLFHESMQNHWFLFKLQKNELLNLSLEEYLVFFLTRCALWKNFKTAHLDEMV